MWVVVGQNVVVESGNGENLNICEVTISFLACMVIMQGENH